VGCGQGTITVGLASTVRYVDAVDREEEAFAEARQYATDNGITNVRPRRLTHHRPREHAA
jgi:tRNA/tmRNA/rRNA uracil-C5-methylase (TrmA/RlmC/RlmD family)